jgi:hypothetical protein
MLPVAPPALGQAPPFCSKQQQQQQHRQQQRIVCNSKAAIATCRAPNPMLQPHRNVQGIAQRGKVPTQ